MLIFSHLRIPTIKQALTGTLLLLALALFMMPQAMACHKGKPHGKDATCEPPGPDPSAGPDPTPIDTMLDLTGPHVQGDESDGWTCSPGGPFTYEIGNYDCAAVQKPIFLRTGTGSSTLVFPKKYRAICTILNEGVTLIPDTGGLSYGWTDGCNGDGDTTCAVEVRAVFSDEGNKDKISTLTNGKANLLDIVMHGMVDSVDDTDPDSNPFWNEREIHINSVVFEFMNAGSTRSAAICTLNIPVEHNHLLSIPVTP